MQRLTHDLAQLKDAFLSDKKELLSEGKKWGKEHLQATKEAAEETSKQAEKYVRENPWTALGWAFLAGAVASLILRETTKAAKR